MPVGDREIPDKDTPEGRMATKAQLDHDYRTARNGIYRAALADGVGRLVGTALTAPVGFFLGAGGGPIGAGAGAVAAGALGYKTMADMAAPAYDQKYIVDNSNAPRRTQHVLKVDKPPRGLTPSPGAAPAPAVPVEKQTVLAAR